MRRLAYLVAVALGVAVSATPGVAFAMSFRIDATAKAPPVRYSERRVTACLRHQDVMAGDLSVEPREYPAAYSGGVVGVVQFFTGFGPKIDSGELFFFKSSASAKDGEPKLVSVFVYGRGLPLVLKAAVKSQGPIAPGTARSLYRHSGNVVLIWDHPRWSAAISNRILDSCLVYSGGR